MNMDERFVPNDVRMDGERRLIILTGPNMGGKSTLLRQTAIATIMAQLGCYVPASKVVLSPVDRIFTRMGARDNIMMGQSTFMIEMHEAAIVLVSMACLLYLCYFAALSPAWLGRTHAAPCYGALLGVDGRARTWNLYL